MSKKNKSSSKGSTSSTLDFNELVFHFQRVFDDETVQSYFIAHLRSEHNEEQWHYVMDMTKIIKMIKAEQAIGVMSAVGKKEMVQLATHIRDTYAKPDAKFEVNVSSDDKKMLIMALDLVISGNIGGTITVQVAATHQSDDAGADTGIQQVLTCVTVLEKQLHIVINQMHYDVWPRFVRSKAWTDYIKRQSSSYVLQVASTREALKYNLRDDNFNNPVLTDEEVRLLFHISKDGPEWTLAGSESKKGVNSFFYNQDTVNMFFPNVSFMDKGTVCKFQGILPFPLDFCVWHLLSMSGVQEFDESVIKFWNMRYFNPEDIKKTFPDQASNVVYPEVRHLGAHQMMLRFPFPITQPRKVLLVSSAAYDPTTETVSLISKSLFHSAPAVQPGGVLLLPNQDVSLQKHDVEGITMCNYELRKIDEGRTQYIQSWVFNLGAWAANPSLQNMIVKSRGNQLRKNILEYLGKKWQEKKQREAKNLPGLGTLYERTKAIEVDIYRTLIDAIKIPERREAYRNELHARSNSSTMNLLLDPNRKLVESSGAPGSPMHTYTDTSSHTDDDSNVTPMTPTSPVVNL